MKKYHLLKALIFVLLIHHFEHILAQNTSKPFADFYVSTVGNDNWTGKLAEPNANKTDGPFATIGQAKKAIRLIKKDCYRNIYVLIRGGEFQLLASEKFSPSDSHYDSYQIVYMAYPDENPVFSSDIAITGWKLASSIKGLPSIANGKVFVAHLPELPNGKERFYTLYDNGKLLPRAASKGFEPTKVMTGGDGGGVDWKGMIKADRNSLWFPSGIIKNWDNLNDIEIFVQPNVGYVTNYLTLASVDEKKSVAQTAIPATYPMGKIDKHLHAMEGGSCRVENVIDYLDTPGEWVINTKEKLVFYWPISGQPKQVTFPALSEYILVDGHESGGIVRNIAFKGLTFTRGEREVITKKDIGLQHEWDMWNKENAMVRFRDAEYCEMSNCRLTNAGSAAVRLDLYAQSNVIKNNLIDYVGGTGILLCGYGPGKLNVNKSNKIINNQIHHCGEFYYQSNGIMVWQSGENIIQNNKLHHLPYDAIVLSGTRPMFFQLKGENREQVGSLRLDEIAPEALYQDDTTSYNFNNFVFYNQWPKTAPYYHTRNNIVEDNEVFLVMQKCFDGNAIYLSDVGDGNQIKRNYIHHLNGVGMQQAIRTDAFLKNTHISENVIYNCNGGGINLKYYENNAYNNIIADIHDIVYENSAGKTNRMFIGYFSIMDVFTRDKMPPYTACNIQNNIFYKIASHNTFYRQGTVNGKLTELKIEEPNIDKNLYFDANLKDHGQSALDYYRTRGADKNSFVADPLFRDIKTGDFRLQENSPAYQLGFKDIDVKRIGITSEFSSKFMELVKKQLGNDYDKFEKLEEICKPIKGAAGKEFKEANGI
ncbi:MAG: peptidase [Chitinophagaceae bacterium BSSC1]|nr:MAG: peptidase [Chitinophagaceae bacterium BSSC1]